MATSSVNPATPGQSVDQSAQNAAIPFDDELPGEPYGDCEARRTEAYDEAAKDSTRRLVKLARGIINRYGDHCAHIGTLCDAGADACASNGEMTAEAIFHSIKLIDLDEGSQTYRLHGILEALIDRLPKEGGAA
jgi:hypothetical protein